MARRTRPWPRLCLTVTMLASLGVAVAPPRDAAATYPGVNGRILFPSASHGGFWTVAPDGTGHRQLTGPAGDYPRFSPDGTKISLRRSSGEIWVMRADGTNARQLPSDAPDCFGVFGTTWSSDSTKIAFSKQCGSLAHIFLTNVDGSGDVTRLTNFDASVPAWSPDGTKIAFESGGNIWVMDADGTDPVQLTTDGDNRVVNWAPDSARLVFGRDGPSDAGRRIYVMNADGTSVTPITPDDVTHDYDPVFSPDGTRIAFVEADHLKVMNADGNNVSDISPVINGTTMRAYSPDWGVALPEAGCRPPSATERVNVASDGRHGTGFRSLGGSISADGRFVAFSSADPNLVVGDTNGFSDPSTEMDVFVRDRSNRVTTRVSVTSDGTQASAHLFTPPVISDDGRFVVFSSDASNLVTVDRNGFTDVFVHDRSTGATTMVSVPTDPAIISDQSNGDSGDDDILAISADGRFVVFSSDASNLVTGDTNDSTDIFVHDRSTTKTSRVSVSSDGTQAGAFSFRPAISSNGKVVAFHSAATDLVVGDTNGSTDIFVHHLATQTTTRVLASDGSQADGHSLTPALSADGRYVAFSSAATNLVPGDTNGFPDVFVHDRSTGVNRLASISSNGVAGNSTSNGGLRTPPALSADGRFVIFTSHASNLVAGDTNGQVDVFAHDARTGATRRVSVASDGSQATGGGTNSSDASDISADGRSVVFTSLAFNLAPGDRDSSADVFVHDWFSRPDAKIKSSKAGYAGNDIYNRTGAGQNRFLTIAPGERALFSIAVQNDHYAADSFRLKGPGPQPGFTPTYLVGRRDVTDRVIAGTFRLASLDPCATETIELIVKAKTTARKGATTSWLLTATPASFSKAADAVKASVKVGR